MSVDKNSSGAKEIGATLRMYRKVSKISMMELAKMSGIAYSSLWIAETKGDISLRNLLKICDALNVTVSLISNKNHLIL